MSVREMVVVMAVVILPSVLFTLAIYYAQSKAFGEKYCAIIYRVSLFGRTSFISEYMVIRTVIVLLMCAWLDVLLPIEFVVMILLPVLVGMGFVIVRQADTKTVSDESDALVRRLTAMQSEIGEIRGHIDGLRHHILSKQLELNEKQRIREQLDLYIRDKTSEAEQWGALTNEQKDLVINAAIQGLRRGSKKSVFLGFLAAFFINLSATFTWTIMGSPGREALIQEFRDLLWWGK
ncbi:hypothetical protein SAMN06265365_105289 [Tistlia consotensis]|uniref:Uncharacterized protein n=1 Tax=Tistlia consotensis USBA 355 TaxID=560819 RepID=A0A1Y6BHA9_9PROT|nr:hypothetical protein [Tistlia consotensis]SMF11467.1 hypothetical protein SAMN05428998_1059 [Tistlia consotensis USBA 355]SNR51954.1 hypothetical protein SAMN06265365_105289 [Tistlia consotensis]